MLPLVVTVPAVPPNTASSERVFPHKVRGSETNGERHKELAVSQVPVPPEPVVAPFPSQWKTAAEACGSGRLQRAAMVRSSGREERIKGSEWGAGMTDGMLLQGPERTLNEAGDGGASGEGAAAHGDGVGGGAQFVVEAGTGGSIEAAR
jgi:hypothetical protein